MSRNTAAAISPAAMDDSPVLIDPSTPLHEQVGILWELVESQRSLILRLRHDMERLKGDRNEILPQKAESHQKADSNDLPLLPIRPLPTPTLGRPIPPLIYPASFETKEIFKSESEGSRNQGDSSILRAQASSKAFISSENAKSVLIGLKMRPTNSQIPLLSASPSILHASVLQTYVQMDASSQDSIQSLKEVQYFVIGFWFLDISRDKEGQKIFSERILSKPPLWLISKNYFHLSALESRCRAVIRSEPSIKCVLNRLPEKSIFNANAISIKEEKTILIKTKDTTKKLSNNLTLCSLVEDFLISLLNCFCEAPESILMNILTEFITTNVCDTPFPQKDDVNIKPKYLQRSCDSEIVSAPSDKTAFTGVSSDYFTNIERVFLTGNTSNIKKNSLGTVDTSGNLVSNSITFKPHSSSQAQKSRNVKTLPILPARNVSSSIINCISDQPHLLSSSSANSGSNSSLNSSENLVTQTPESGFAKLFKMATKTWGSNSSSMPITPLPVITAEKIFTKRIFGVPLSEALNISQIFGLPSIFFRCVEFLNAKNACHEEGIYRLSGSSAVITNLRSTFEAIPEFNLLVLEPDSFFTDIDINDVTGLLKLYLRELPLPLITIDLPELQGESQPIDEERVLYEIQKALTQIPSCNLILLRTLMAHLTFIVENSAINRMNARNIAIVFTPTLQIPIPVFLQMLKNFKAIFNVDFETCLSEIFVARINSDKLQNPKLLISTDKQIIQSSTIIKNRLENIGINERKPQKKPIDTFEVDFSDEAGALILKNTSMESSTQRLQKLAPRVTLNFDNEGLGDFDFSKALKNEILKDPLKISPNKANEKNICDNLSPIPKPIQSTSRTLPPLPPESSASANMFKEKFNDGSNILQKRPKDPIHRSSSISLPLTTKSDYSLIKAEVKLFPEKPVGSTVFPLKEPESTLLFRENNINNSEPNFITKKAQIYAAPPRGASRNLQGDSSSSGTLSPNIDESSARQRLQWLLHVDGTTLSKEVGKLNAQQMEQLRRLMIEQAEGKPLTPPHSQS